MCVRQQEKWGLATSDQHHPDEGVADNKLRHYARVCGSQFHTHTHAREKQHHHAAAGASGRKRRDL